MWSMFELNFSCLEEPSVSTDEVEVDLDPEAVVRAEVRAGVHVSADNLAGLDEAPDGV